MENKEQLWKNKTIIDSAHEFGFDEMHMWQEISWKWSWYFESEFKYHLANRSNVQPMITWS